MTNPVTVTAVDGVTIEDIITGTDKAAVKQLAKTFLKRAAVTVALVGTAIVVINVVNNKLKQNEIEA